MQLKALIATLVLGSSSVALASPEIRDHRTPTTTTVTTTNTTVTPLDIRAKVAFDYRYGHRPDPRPMPPVYQQPLTWVSLADNMDLDRGRASIKVAASQRQFTKLAIRADGNGRTSIDKVMIVFGNGQRQVVDVDAKLSKKNPSLTIDLQGNSRNIERIMLVGKSNGRNASVDILAI